MKPFDYIVVFVSIVIGLAITDLATSLHRLIRAHGRVVWHWAAPACALLAALSVLRTFWVFWYGYHDIGPMPLWRFLPITLPLVLMFLGAAAALPDDVPAEGLNLRAFYLRNRAHFWGVTAAWFASVVLHNMVVGWLANAPVLWSLQVVNGVALATILSLIFVRRLWWHAIAFALLFAGVVWSWMPLTVG